MDFTKVLNRSKNHPRFQDHFRYLSELMIILFSTFNTLNMVFHKELNQVIDALGKCGGADKAVHQVLSNHNRHKSYIFRVIGATNIGLNLIK